MRVDRLSDDDRALLIHRFAPLYYSEDFQQLLQALEAFYQSLGDPLYEQSALTETFHAFLDPEQPTAVH